MATKRICSIDGCGKPLVARYLCERHYRRHRQHGNALFVASPKEGRRCSVPGCTKLHDARGWCRMHYGRWRAHGDPLAVAFHLAKAGEPAKYFREVVCTYEGNECLIWPFSRGSSGYGKFYNDGRLVGVHREACKVANGPPPTPRHEAAHSCGNGHEGCCTKKHLSWKTPKQNADDQLTHGSRRFGERHQNSKLTEEDVRQIRSLKGAVSQRDLATRFGTSRSNIGLIHKGQRWNWLP